jgi:hypothetical protein
MAERRTGSGGGSKSSGSRSSKSSGEASKRGSKRAGAGTTRASSQRTPTATRRERPSDRSPTGGDSNGGDVERSQKAQTGGKAMGRPGSSEPDVYLYVPKLHVGELCVDVERLEAHLALRAQVANLVNLVAGVHVSVDKVKIDIKDVDAEAELKVRLENTYNILDRTLTTLDENPEIVHNLLETADSAVQETGQIGREATRPGGAVSELGSGVGDSLGNMTSSLGDSLSSVADKASPRRLVSGQGKSPKTGGGSSSGRRQVLAAGAAGLAGLAGAALLGGTKKGRFGRRTALGKAIDRVRQ